MPYSYHFWDEEIAEWVKKHWPLDAAILDVGPGSGKFARILPEYQLDGIEIFAPYIQRFNLNAVYKSVTVGDAMGIDLHKWEYFLLGDVLEHFTVTGAKKLLEKMMGHGKSIVVQVPYLYPQGSVGGNAFERHLQPDLTPEIFEERYPGFTMLGNNQHGGTYVWLM